MECKNLLASQANPLVSVIILNFNGKGYLYNCIESVLKNRYKNFEIILVDNASTDQSLKYVKNIFGADPRIRIIQNTKNMGFSGGNNIGFQHSKGQYIVFLNNDTTVAPDWLTTLIHAMNDDPTIGLAQSVVLNMDGKKIQTAGWLFSDFLIQKIPLCEGKSVNFPFKPVFEVSFVSGASMMVRREIVEEMGLFDSQIPFFYDDTLLSLKTELLERKVVTVAASRIRHFGGATNIWTIKSTTFHLTKSKIILLFDIYRNKFELAKALSVHIAYLLVTSIFCLKSKNVAAVIGNFDALTWSLRNLRYLWQNGLNLWRKTKISPEELKQKFARIKMPIASYLFPSKKNTESFASTINDYEKKFITKKYIRRI